MKKCPFCAEEIQNTAIKCRYCSEWLKIDGHVKSPNIAENNEFNKNNKRICLSLKEVKFTNYFIYLLAIPGLVILADIIFGIALGKLPEENDSFVTVLGFILYFSLAIGIAAHVFTIRRLFLVIGISIVNLFLVRFLIIVFSMPALLGESMFTTLLEALCIFIPVVCFTFIFRFTAVKFPFVEIHNVEQDILSDGKKCDFGVCGRCGNRIKIAKERFMSVFGKSERHSCENCGIFLRENPFHVMFYGLAEIGIFIILFGGLVAHYDGNTSTSQNAFGLFLFFGLIDGLRRLFAGAAACLGLKLRKHEFGQNLEGKLQKISSLVVGRITNDELDLTCPQCGHYARTRAKIGDNAVCPICKLKFTIEARLFEKEDATSVNQH